MTVYLVTGKQQEQLGTYDVSGAAAVGVGLDVCVVEFRGPSDAGTAVASEVIKAFPRQSREVRSTTEYADPAPALADWILRRETRNAARDGDLQKVQALLKARPDLAVRPRELDGASPLHWAAAAGHKNVVELLLANKADANVRDSLGQTPLHWIAPGGQRSVLEYLLYQGISDRGSDTKYEALPQRVFSRGQRDVVELLLAHGAEVNAVGHLGRTPLYWAAAGCERDLVELLLAHKANANARDSSGLTPLRGAAAGCQSDVAELLRQHGGHE